MKPVRTRGRQKSTQRPRQIQGELDDRDPTCYKPFSMILPSRGENYSDVELQCTAMDLILKCLNPSECEKLADQGLIAEIVHALIGVQSEDLQLMLLTILRQVSSVDAVCATLQSSSPAVIDFLLQKLAMNKKVEFGKRWIACDARAQSYLILAAFAAHTHPLLSRLRQFQYVSHDDQRLYKEHSRLVFQLCWEMESLPTQTWLKQAQNEFTWGHLAAGALVNLGHSIDPYWWAPVFTNHSKSIQEFRHKNPDSLLSICLVELILAKAPEILEAQPAMLSPALYTPSCWETLKLFFNQSDKNAEAPPLCLVQASAQYLWLLTSMDGTATDSHISDYVTSFLSDIREDGTVNEMVKFALDRDMGEKFPHLISTTWQLLSSLYYNFGEHFSEMIDIVMVEPSSRHPNPVAGNAALHLAVLITLIKPLLPRRTVRRVQKCVRGFASHAPLPLKPILRNAYIGLVSCLNPVGYYDPQELEAWQERTLRRAKDRSLIEKRIVDRLKRKADGSDTEIEDFLPVARVQDPADEPYEFDVGSDGGTESYTSGSDDMDDTSHCFYYESMTSNGVDL